MKCPDCGDEAYVGFSTVECSNHKCKHFVVTTETICPCCGGKGHFEQRNGAKCSANQVTPEQRQKGDSSWSELAI